MNEIEGEVDNVKVVVRCRPLDEQEIREGHQHTVQVNRKSISVRNPTSENVNFFFNLIKSNLKLVDKETSLPLGNLKKILFLILAPIINIPLINFKMFRVIKLLLKKAIGVCLLPKTT